MRHSVIFLFTIALLAGAAPALARGGHGGGHGGHSGGFVGGHPGFHSGFHSGFVVRPGFVHSRPFIHHGGRVIVGSAIVIGGVGWPYYYYPPAYYPPDYAPGYADDYPQGTTYIEQSDQVRYFCPDSRAYYPDVTTCASDWLRVVP